MKLKLFTAILLALLTNIKASASYTWTNGATTWEFSISGGNATVLGISGSIPSTLNIPTHLYVGTTQYPVTRIGAYAFKDITNLERVKITNWVDIGKGAFMNCSKLALVEFDYIRGLDLKTIGDGAFMNCSELTYIEIPHFYKSIGQSAFAGCSKLRDIQFSAYEPQAAYIAHYFLESIGAYAFENCTSLKEVTILESVESIGVNAFKGCSSLASVTLECEHIGKMSTIFGTNVPEYTIGRTVKSISGDAFSDCTGLKRVKIVDLATWCATSFETYPFPDLVTLYFNNQKITNLVIPNTVTSIGSYTFCLCTSLKSITIPNSVTSIGEGAFAGTGLKSVTIPNSVTSIGEGAFSACSDLTNVTFPNSVTSINFGTFQDCTSLTNITIPNSVTSIGGYAFQNCTSLTSVDIPNSVNEIGSDAFYGCTSLTSVTIGNGVKSIELNTFKDCTSLTDVTIGSSLKDIGSNAFNNCPLMYVRVNRKTPPTLNETSLSNTNNATLYVPTGSKDNYKKANIWKDFKKIWEVDVPNMTETYTFSCWRGDVSSNGSKLYGTREDAASEFAFIDYEGTNYLYDVTHKAFVIHTTAAKAGSTGNPLLESQTDFFKAVKGLKRGKTNIEEYPYYLEDGFGNWLNMDKNLNVCMNTWQNFEGGRGGNTYQIEVVDDWYDASEALEMLDSYFASHRNLISDLSELSNSKQYIICTKDEARGSLGVANGELASTNPEAQGHKCEEATPFAILQYGGNYYLYSTADLKFITGTGGETDSPQTDDAWTLVKNDNGYFMFKVASTGNVLNVNNSPGIQINTWGQDARYWDDGNQFTIEEAGDFDATEAIQMLVNYIVAATDEQYQAALNSVVTDTQYAIYTLNGRTRYYLTSEGYLTAHPTRDCVLTFARTGGDGLFRSPGWKVDACFTNPHLSENGGASGDLLPQGHILTDKQGRDDWDGQVWYLGDNGCYAVRATNAVSDTWGANTYWTVLDANGDGVPEADYSWTPAFIWLLESDVESVGIRGIDNGPCNESGAWYTLDGRKLNAQPATKGIYIRNNQKVLLK